MLCPPVLHRQLNSGTLLNEKLISISRVTTSIPSVTFTVVTPLPLQGKRNRPTITIARSRTRPSSVVAIFMFKTRRSLSFAMRYRDSPIDR